MHCYLLLSFIVCVASAQYIAVGEPNPNAPTCLVEVPSCPENPPVPVILPLPIPNAFETVFRNIDEVIYGGIDAATKLHKRIATQMTDRFLRLQITDDIEPTLAIGFQLGINLWQLVISNTAQALAEFSQMFNTQFNNVKQYIQLVNDDQVAKAVLEAINPNTYSAMLIYGNSAINHRQIFVDTYSQFADYARKLHRRALASPCPKQLQQEFEEATFRLNRQLDDLFESYVMAERQICANYRQGIRCSAVTLNDCQLVAVTVLLT